MFATESILAAANKVFNFNRYKKEQAQAIYEIKRQQINNEPFVNENILAAANKLFDFDKSKNSRPTPSTNSTITDRFRN